MEFTVKFEQPKRKELKAGKFRTIEEAGKFKTDLLMKGLAKIDPSFWETLSTK
ncbi:hypothetical protein LXM25_27675 [Dyadobacter sp. LJ53]|uniref:hypothetical protein n=1 Tax=Dyadobacter chenwenxiniae TaxID=2906456 RepID=UPI001F481859|nr:hypothetical protein [Dyadobacter chenwenxiniae]MCF0053885.1 hypothetical protein [Dyadobacter chenwenxiniae]